MKIIDVAQNSLEWLTARAGIPTASEWDNLVTPKFEIRKGDMVRTYLAQKVAEAWLRSPIANFMSIDAEFGHILEEEAIPWVAFQMDKEVERPGLITSDDGRIGCSPDGVIENRGIEIKCPAPHTHARYLLNGEVPKDYLHQVHGGMLVTGFSQWIFVSYHRRFPKLVLTVDRDEKIIAILQEALSAFLEKFDAAMKRLTELNGGLPARQPQL